MKIFFQKYLTFDRSFQIFLASRVIENFMEVNIKAIRGRGGQNGGRGGQNGGHFSKLDFHTIRSFIWNKSNQTRIFNEPGL